MWDIAEAVPRVIAKATPEDIATAILLAIVTLIVTLIVGAIFSKRVPLIVVWCNKQVWSGFWLLRILGHSPGLLRRVASGTVNGCRRLWGTVQAMRRERLKRQVIKKLRCYEARGELPAEQVGFLVQAIALL